MLKCLKYSFKTMFNSDKIFFFLENLNILISDKNTIESYRAQKNYKKRYLKNFQKKIPLKCPPSVY